MKRPIMLGLSLIFTALVWGEITQQQPTQKQAKDCCYEIGGWLKFSEETLAMNMPEATRAILVKKLWDLGYTCSERMSDHTWSCR